MTAAGIPDDVAFAAEYPTTAGPQPPEDAPAERIRTEGWCLLMTPMPTLNFVEPRAIGPDAVEATVEQVRALLRARGRRQAAWCVPGSARPADLYDQLVALGMRPYDQPPLEPEYAAMALTEPPAGSAGDDVDVHLAADLDEFVASMELDADVHSFSEEDRAASRAANERRWRMVQEGRSPMQTYVAYVDSVMVGAAASLNTDAAVNLSGGSVVPSARGRGVYRALVLARWEAAVARGTPALTVQAGAMSRPILERLGFTTVSVVPALLDAFS